MSTIEGWRKMSITYSDIRNLRADTQNKVIESETSYREKKLNAGWIGIVFGMGDNAAKNIAGFLAASSMLTGVSINIIQVLRGTELSFECWKVFVPIITGTLGYIFGRK